MENAPEVRMEGKELGKNAVERLKKLYPDDICTLSYGGDAWRLLIMGRLSAQCTDKRVNIVSEELFAEYPDVFALAQADVTRVGEIIRTCGLYNSKAKSIVEMSRIIVDRFGGEVPEAMDDLLSLPGVGRKIANLVRGDIFGCPAVVTDTHCIRICGRLGFYPEELKDPPKIEKILSKVIEPNEQASFCHRLVDFGRDICTARKTYCEKCPLKDICAHNNSEK